MYMASQDLKIAMSDFFMEPVSPRSLMMALNTQCSVNALVLTMLQLVSNTVFPNVINIETCSIHVQYNHSLDKFNLL